MKRHVDGLATGPARVLETNRMLHSSEGSLVAPVRVQQIRSLTVQKVFLRLLQKFLSPVYYGDLRWCFARPQEPSGNGSDVEM